MKKLIILICLVSLIGCDNSVEPNEIITTVSGVVMDDSTNEVLDSVSLSITKLYSSFSNNSWYASYETLCTTLSNNQGFYSLSTRLEKDRFYKLCVYKSGYRGINEYSIDRIKLVYKQNQTINVRLKRQ